MEVVVLILAVSVLVLVIIGRSMQSQTRSKETGQKFAGFWVRLASITLDGLLILVLSIFTLYCVTALFYSMITTESYLKFILFFYIPFASLASFFYIAWFDAEGRSTVGKKLFGLEVVTTAFKPISFSKSLLRTLAYVIDIPGIWVILLSKKKQTVHDMLAKTYVIRAKAPHKLEKVFVVSLFAFFVGDFFLGTDYIRSHYIHNYIQSFYIPVSSMKPTLLVGDFILVDKYWARDNSPQKGDLIIFKYPPNPDLDYVKRCIAKGGQTVEVRNRNVYVDGKPEGNYEDLGQEYDVEYGLNLRHIKVTVNNNRSYKIGYYVDHYNQKEYGPVTVPAGNYFVMGDNRNNSADSRSWGFVPKENVIGKAGIIYWSWDRFNNKIRWSRIGEALE